jgi:hypothetical protein
MRALSGLAAFFLLFASAAAAQRSIDRGMALDPTAGIRVYNLTGSVTVRGWNRDSIAVHGTLGKGDELHMGGTRTGMKMFVEGMDDRNPAPSKIELMVPARAKVWIKTATAGIDVRDVSGSLDLYVVSGDVFVTGSPADVNAEAIDGSITINGSPDWVRAKSASGNVTFTGSSGDITATTVSGRISINGRQFEKAKFESVTGDIRFAGAIERSGLATFDSHSGAVTIALPLKGQADLDAVSIAGSITNRFSRTPARAGRYGRGAELVTEANGGGGRVVVRSFKGPVVFDVMK